MAATTEQTTQASATAGRPAAGNRYRDWFGLLYAYRLDGHGGGVPMDWQAIAADDGRAPVWIHLDLNHPNAQRWLAADSGLDRIVVDALTARQASPRLMTDGDAALMVLKGLNYSAGAAPTEMVDLRLWTDGHRIITCRRERVRAGEDVHRRLSQGRGPLGPASLIVHLADLLTAHMEDVIQALFDETHRLGHAGDRAATEDLVARLAHLRRRMIHMRRELGPQQRTLSRLANSRLTWLDAADRRLLHEVVSQCRQYVEGLDAAQQISGITQDEILQRSSEKTERRVYALTVLSAIFMPITFVTGLLGVNLGGIPGAENPRAFLVLCLILTGIVGLQLWLLRRMRWV